MAEFGDPEFIQSFVAGDDRAFRAVFEHYYPGLFATCIKYIRPRGTVEDAKDIVSITFQKLYERRSKIDSTAGITRFLYLAIRTGSIDLLRRKRKVIASTHDLAAMQATINDEIDVGFWESVMKEKQVMDMISSLPERSREVIVLFYLKGLKYREIGEHMDISPRTVENQLRYALEKLRSALVDRKVSGVLLLTTAAFAGIITEVVYVIFVLHISGMLPKL